MPKIYNLNPVSFITIDTVGQPGQRVFYLQAGQGNQLVTLIIEKQHAMALVTSLDELLGELNVNFPNKSLSGFMEKPAGLHFPLEPKFHVGQMGLGYDETVDLVVLIAYQLYEPNNEASEAEYFIEEDVDVTVARFWGTREQMLLLRQLALDAVNGGRPVCGLCGELIGPEGHFCIRRNGKGKAGKYD